MLKSLCVFAVLMSGTPAIAGNVSSPTESAAKAKDPKRKICQPVEETGSRLSSKRICMTAEQWLALQRDTLESKRGEKAGGDRGRD